MMMVRNLMMITNLKSDATKVPADASHKEADFEAKSSTEGAQNKGVAGQYHEDAVLFKDDKNSKIESTNFSAENNGGGSIAGEADQNDNMYEGDTIATQPPAIQEKDENSASSNQHTDIADDVTKDDTAAADGDATRIATNPENQTADQDEAKGLSTPVKDGKSSSKKAAKVANPEKTKPRNKTRQKKKGKKGRGKW